MIQDIAVNSKGNPKAKENQPDDGSLFEVFLKRVEKGLCDITFLVFYHFSRNIVQCSRGSTDREDGKTAYEPQNVQIGCVDDFCNKLHNRIIRIE